MNKKTGETNEKRNEKLNRKLNEKTDEPHEPEWVDKTVEVETDETDETGTDLNVFKKPAFFANKKRDLRFLVIF